MFFYAKKKSKKVFVCVVNNQSMFVAHVCWRRNERGAFWAKDVIRTSDFVQHGIHPLKRVRRMEQN
jgi:hypothetical protein